MRIRPSFVGVAAMVVWSVAACGSTRPAPTASSAPSAVVAPTPAAPSASVVPPPSFEPMPSLPAGIEFIPVGSLMLSADGTVIDLKFAGARPFDPADPCSADYSAWTHVGEVLDVGIWESKRLPGANACDAVGHGRELRATLDRPFAGTVWRDVSAPFIHFLAAPPGLATIDVPDGWRLIDEGDREDSPTGRWQRTYAPRPDAGPEERLTIYQSFDGAVSVTGGEELGAPKIGDRFGTSYRHAPSGEIVLVWPWGAGELALSANEHVIPMPMLIRIAESAR